MLTNRPIGTVKLSFEVSSSDAPMQLSHTDPPRQFNAALYVALISREGHADRVTTR